MVMAGPESRRPARCNDFICPITLPESDFGNGRSHHDGAVLQDISFRGESKSVPPFKTACGGRNLRYLNAINSARRQKFHSIPYRLNVLWPSIQAGARSRHRQGLHAGRHNTIGRLRAARSCFEDSLGPRASRAHGLWNQAHMLARRPRSQDRCRTFSCVAGCARGA